MTRGNDDPSQAFSPKLLGVWRTPPSPLPLKAGMAVTAEVKLGERSVMEYLLSPIERTLDYAAKER